MRIALTGGTGFIGSATARSLAHAGHEVIALTRSASQTSHIQDVCDRFVQGSVEDRDAHHALLQEADVLVHNAFDWKPLKDGDLQTHMDRNLSASLDLIDLAATTEKQVIFVSSVAVHHMMLPEWNGQIDDTHPSRPGTRYGSCKVAIEAHLWALHATMNMPFTIIRPAAVYGLDPNLERSIGTPIIRSIQEGKAYTRAGGGKFVHVDDVAESITRAVSNPAANTGIYHLADCYARWSEWARMTSEMLGITVSIDDQSPDKPRNMFTLDRMKADLNLDLQRGHEGIRLHLHELANAMGVI